VERFSPLQAFGEDERDDARTPWADPPEGSARLVWLSIRWSADDEDLETIVELARTYDLVLYDPQGPSLHSPWDEDERTPYVPSAGEFVRGALLAAVGVLVAVVAWSLSIPVLSWIMLFVGGFVTLVAVFSVAAISQQAWRARASRAP